MGPSTRYYYDEEAARIARRNAEIYREQRDQAEKKARERQDKIEAVKIILAAGDINNGDKIAVITQIVGGI